MLLDILEPGAQRRTRRPAAIVQARGRETRTAQRTGIGTRNRHGIVRLLAGRRRDVLLDGVTPRGGKTRLLERGCCVRDAHGRRLQGEGLGRRKRVVLARVLGVLLGEIVSLFEVGVVVVGGGRRGRVQVGAEAGRFGEARRVGRRLAAELGEVEVGAGAVADVHALVEAALGADAVEDDGVDGYGEDFDDDFDESADEGPVLLGPS